MTPDGRSPDPQSPVPGARVRLPDRRPSVPQPFDWAGWHWLAGIGFTPHGTAGEVFLDCTSPDCPQGFVQLGQDLAILVSHHLQRGVTPRALAAWLGRPGLPPDHPQQGLAARLAHVVVDVEARDGAAMREAYRLTAARQRGELS